MRRTTSPTLSEQQLNGRLVRLERPRVVSHDNTKTQIGFCWLWDWDLGFGICKSQARIPSLGYRRWDLRGLGYAQHIPSPRHRLGICAVWDLSWRAYPKHRSQAWDLMAWDWKSEFGICQIPRLKKKLGISSLGYVRLGICSAYPKLNASPWDMRDLGFVLESKSQTQIPSLGLYTLGFALLGI